MINEIEVAGEVEVEVQGQVLLSEKQIEDKCKSSHYEMIHKYVTTGMSSRELGNLYDISEAHIQHMKKTSLWKSEEELLRASLRMDNQVKIELLVPDAINTIKNVMNDEMNSSTSRVNAAAKALEIAEYGKARGDTSRGERSVTLNLMRPKWDEGDGSGGDTINIQVNVE